jgi:hypothetical protein
MTPMINIASVHYGNTLKYWWYVVMTSCSISTYTRNWCKKHRQRKAYDANEQTHDSQSERFHTALVKPEL